MEKKRGMKETEKGELSGRGSGCEGVVVVGVVVVALALVKGSVGTSSFVEELVGSLAGVCGW